ncbi:MAG TPA: cellulase family glycosylhydrolase [Phycisphaerae bacterium]|nr:cellulase family glycosylhydrolase [Phycisphaerae bacterium]
MSRITVFVMIALLTAARPMRAADGPTSRPARPPVSARTSGINKTSPGLYVENGVLMKDGRPFRGIGINYFNAFIRDLGRERDTSYREGLQVLHDRGIPFIRFALNDFWPAGWALFVHDRPEFYARLDAFVAEAERLGIGLIPSFVWQFGVVPDVAGEPIDQWGNGDSQTHVLFKQYVTGVVGRYAKSPTFWAWEFGNEFRLHIDLHDPKLGVPPTAPKLGTPATRGSRDKLQRGAVEFAQRRFARIVRTIDPDRLLVTGDSLPRRSAYHLMTRRNWERDTQAQFAAMLLRDNPDPYDTLSGHLYPQEDREFFPERASLKELLSVCQDVATASGKPFFLGEFGDTRERGLDKSAEAIRELLDAVVSLRIPLSAVWVYDLSLQKDTYSITADNEGAWVLDAIRQANRRLQADLPESAVPSTAPG